MDAGQDDVARADVETLLTMSQVHLASTGVVTPGAPRVTQGAGDVTAAQARRAVADVERARDHLRQQYVVGTDRFRLPKRVALRASRRFTGNLVAAAAALADAVDGLLRIHAESVDEVDRRANSLRAQLVSAEQAWEDSLDALARRSGAAGGRDEPLAGVVARLESRIDQLEDAEAARLEDLAELRAAVATARPGSVDTAPAPLSDEAYALFEQRFRGTREEIRDRQQDALRFVTHLAGSARPVLDVGCGRGEWLELLAAHDVPAYGVDSNAAMVAEAVAVGLDARTQDAIAHLRTLAPGSLQGLTAFHVAEHVPVHVLGEILRLAHDAVADGGLVVLETPNPTNVVVGSSAFYLDPTHLRPLHPHFLAFLVEAQGFTDVEVHFVHPAVDEATLRGDDTETTWGARVDRLVQSGEWALFGPQDYLVVGRKPGSAR